MPVGLLLAFSGDEPDLFSGLSLKRLLLFCLMRFLANALVSMCLAKMPLEA
jgi:hypothetical protein